MSAITFITATARDRAGAPAVVRLAGGGSAAPYLRDGQHHWAGLFDRPRFRAELGFGKDGWTGGTVPTTGEITWMPAEPGRLRQLGDLYWPDAQIIVEGGPELGPIGRLLTGTVANAGVADGLLTLTVADLSAAIDKPLVTASFKGTGELEGPTEATGKPKRRSWGRVFNVEARPLVPAYEIHEVGDPTRPLQAIPVARDKGRDGPLEVLGWAGSVQATLDALKARVPPRGGAVVAPSIACVRWWTTPAGPLTCDLVGEVGVASAAVPITSAVLAAVAGPLVTDAPAAGQLRPAAAGLHVGTLTETAAQALDRLLLGVSLLWVLEPSGLVRIREWTWDTAAAPALQARFIARQRTLPPMAKRRVGHRTNNRVHTAAEISAALFLEDAAASPNFQLPTPAEITKLGTIADGATKNRVFRQVAEPASPVNGDVWVDISQSPQRQWVRIGGSWQTAANYTTATGQLTDDAGLGRTALWGGVTGPGTPASNATRNDDGANMLPSPIDNATWAFFGGAAAIDRGDNTRLIGRVAGTLPGNGSGVQFATGAAVPNVTASDMIFARQTLQGFGLPANSTDYVALQLICYDAAGAFVGTVDFGGVTTGAALVAAGGTWTMTASAKPLAGTARVNLQARRTGGGAGLFVAGEPYLGRTQPGADVTATNTAADTAKVNGVPASTVSTGGARAFVGLDEYGLLPAGANSLDRIADSDTYKRFAGNERVKLTGIAAGADVTLFQPIVSQLDSVSGRMLDVDAAFPALIAGYKGIGTTTVALSAATSGTSSTITVPAWERRLPGRSGQKVTSFAAGSIPGLTPGTGYLVFVDGLAGGTVAYQATTNSDDLNVAGRILVGSVATPAAGGGTTTGGGGTGGYTGGTGSSGGGGYTGGQPGGNIP